MMILIFFVLMKFVSASHNANMTLIETAVHVTSKFYKYQFVTSVVSSGDVSEEVNSFLTKFRGSVITSTLYGASDEIVLLNKEKRVEYAQTVFFTKEPEAFEVFMINIIRKLKFPIRLVLVLTKPVQESSELSRCFAAAWYNNLVDILIISQNKQGEVTLQTYFPYKNGICGNFAPVRINIGVNMFPKKLNNFNRCPIRTTLFSLPPFVSGIYENGAIIDIAGYDSMIIKITMNKINATLDLRVNPDKLFGSYLNGTATGAFKDLVYNKTDMFLPSGIMTYARQSVAQVSHINYIADMRWVGPKPREIYHDIKLIIAFLNNSTSFLCIAFSVTVTLATLIKRRRPCKRDSCGSVCFEIFTLLLGQAANYITKIPLLNNLFLIWIWFSLLISTIYQCYLVDSLQTKNLEPRFTTLEESVKRVKGYGGTVTTFTYYINTSLERNFEVLNKSDLDTKLRQIVHGERYLVAVHYLTFRRFRYSVQFLDIKISTSLVCFYFRAGWPGVETVSSYITRLIESGIAEKLKSINDDSQKETGINIIASPLDMSMFSSCFYVMGLLWLLCLFIFLIEITYYKYKTRTRKNKRIPIDISTIEIKSEV